MGGGKTGNAHQQAGCGCRTTGDDERSPLGLALVAGLVAASRRRRRALK
jgi:MYXO-CTERM domain-containing protein